LEITTGGLVLCRLGSCIVSPVYVNNAHGGFGEEAYTFVAIEFLGVFWIGTDPRTQRYEKS
jgi:hypothetical protein